jgi:hypothetical protein
VEAAVEEFDVVPHSCLDAPARIDELEREVRTSSPCPQTLLARDGEKTFDDPVLRELGDRDVGRHPGECRPECGW